jgi:hypothetical protein
METGVGEGQRGRGGVFTRAIAILSRPNSEWAVIDTEGVTIGRLLIGYAGVLAALRAVCGVIGGQLYRFGLAWTPSRPSWAWSLRDAVAGFALTLAATFVVALAINLLAPAFGARKNLVQSAKLSVYAGTAGWVGGMLWPFADPWWVASLLGLYGLYLLAAGLPRLMEPAPRRAWVYTIIVLIAAGAIDLVAEWGARMIAGPPERMVAASGRGDLEIVNIDGQSIDLRRLEAAARAARASEAVDPEKLQALIPDRVDGVSRVASTTQSATDSAMSASSVVAVFGGGEVHMTLSVTDLKALGPYADVMVAIDARSIRPTAGGHEKVGIVGGRPTIESWDGAARKGLYEVMVAHRFIVEAKGSAASVEVLKDAVGAVGPDRLEALAKH